MTENGPPDARNQEIRALREKVSQLEAAQEQLRQAEEALREASEKQQQLEAVFNRGPAMLFLWRVEEGWPVKLASENVSQLGYSAEDFTSGRVSWSGITHADDILRLEAEVAAFLRDGVDEFHQEYRLLTKSGEVRWVEDRNVCRRDAEGNVIHVKGVVLDITERKHAEEALRNSEARYRALFESSRDAVVLLDGLSFVDCNDAALQLYGVATRQEFLGKAPSEISPPIQPDGRDSRQAERDRAAETLANGSAHFEWRHVRPDGTEFDADVLVSRVELRGKAVLQGVVRDITERRRMEQALRESEARYRTLVESAGEAIFTMDETPRYLFMNSTAAERLGGRPEDFIGKTMWDLFPKEIADRQASMVRKAIRTGQGSLTEMVTQIQGQPRWYHTSIEPLRDERGRVTSALVIARDITEREQTERRYRAIIEIAIDGFWISDMDGRLLEVNDSLARMLGYRRDEMLGMHVSDVDADETPQETASHICRTAHRGTDRFETRHRRKDGEVLDVDVSVNYLDIEGGRFFVFVRDITARKEAEREVEQARARLVTAREQERRRLAGELHDSIGQSLVALQLTVQNAAAAVRDRLDAEHTAALVKATAQCTELIRDVRHICHGLYPPILESLGLVAGLRQLAEDVESAGIAASVRCSKAIEARRFSSETEIALFRIAQQAVTNAIRHGESENIGIALRRKRGGIHLTIEDNGVGFAPEEIASNGLGLMHMRERARAAGGTLAIRSKKGRTRVEAVLPDRPPGEGNDPAPLVIDPPTE